MRTTEDDFDQYTEDEDQTVGSDIEEVATAAPRISCYPYQIGTPWHPMGGADHHGWESGCNWERMTHVRNYKNSCKVSLRN